MPVIPATQIYPNIILLRYLSVAGIIGTATNSKNGLMKKYSVPYCITVSSDMVNKIYKVVLTDEKSNLYGSVGISICHPYYGSVVTCFIPRGEHGSVLYSNTLGTYRGIFNLYTDNKELYIKVTNNGADRLVITPLSLNAITLENVTDSVDLSTMTTI